VAVSLTLGIVKPDAVATGKTGKILAHLEEAGFTLRAARLVRLTDAQAGAFYAVHRGRPFYPELVAFMTSGPCLPMALEREDAVATLRSVIHASDSDENAAREVAFFFPEGELAGMR
jgi:nucleoside-diphosphate kinase